MAFRHVLNALKAGAAPFINVGSRVIGRYSVLLVEAPIVTKSITSWLMYGAGDMICQVGESTHNGTPVKIDWKRTAVMVTFGTFFSGPLYHYWFAYLDTIPIRMFELRKQRQRWQILRAYNVLRTHNLPVGELVLPDTKPFHKYTIKASKILMDQLVFSSLYLLAFFMGIGIMNDIAGVGNKDKKEPEIHTMINSLHTMKNSNNVEAIDNIIRTLENQQQAKEKTFTDMVKDAWQHTKDIYVPTYVADWVVWPPLQLVNFTFVPLRYQVLYVNMCNLLWNTFLSFMANGGH